jgi:hypothetical protein
MHLAVGTPMYGGYCCSEYVKSMLSLKGSMEAYKHEMTGIFVGNESLVQRARDKIAHIFLQTDASHLLFMDADQSFEPRDIVKLIKADKGIIAGCVPMKGINWERVKQGAKNNYGNLESLTGIFNIRELPGHSADERDFDKPFQVAYAGTGYMLIRRDVFETIAPHVGSYRDKGGALIKNYFSAQIVGEELLSEDFHFCHLYQQHGGQVWAAPWCTVEHFGSYSFKGSYGASNSFDKWMVQSALVGTKEKETV